MGRSQETFNKKEVRSKKEKKRKDKEKKRLARKEKDKSGATNDMIAYVDENGVISSVAPDPEKKSEIEVEDIQIGVPKRDDADEIPTDRRGIVTFFNDSKGYGFIRDMDTQESIFVHVNDLQEEIKENNKVTYEIAKGPKGLVAKGVKVDKS
jgi:cold shock CspA family protein